MWHFLLISFFILRPLKRTLHSLFPPFQLLLTLLFCHLWGELTADLPVAFYFGGVFPETGGEPCKIRGAKGGGFDAAWTDHLSVEKVSLELHEEVIGASATVYAESAEINARILLHGFQNVVYLVSQGLYGCAHQMSFSCASGKPKDSTSCILCRRGSNYLLRYYS